MQNDVQLSLSRDSSFATFSGVVYNEDGEPLEDVIIRLDEMESKSDAQGRFCFEIPVLEQTVAKR